jgi:hypothetical protein
VRIVVSEVERQSGDKEHTYAHLPNQSTPGDSKDLVTVVKKKVVKCDETSGKKTVGRKVKKRRKSPTVSSKTSEPSNQRARDDAGPSRAWRFGKYSTGKNAKARRDNATLEHDTPVRQTNSGSSSQSSTASNSRRRAALPSSTVKVDSAVATQEPTSRRRQTAPVALPSTPTPVKSNSDPSDGGQTTGIMTDDPQDPATTRGMFQQPGMTRGQSNAFVFDPARENPSDANGSAIASGPGSRSAIIARKQSSTSSGLRDLSQLQTQMLTQPPPQAQADIKARQLHYRSKLGQLPHEMQTQASVQMGAELEARMEAQLNSVGLGRADFGDDVEEEDLIGL